MIEKGQLYSTKTGDQLFIVQEKLDEEISYTIQIGNNKKNKIEKMSLWSVYDNNLKTFNEMFESEFKSLNLLSQ
jgi:hypothetical protein